MSIVLVANNNDRRLANAAIPLLYAGTLLNVICYEQLLDRWDKPFTLKHEFGNCPEWPTNTIKFWDLAVNISTVTNFHYPDRDFVILD